MSSPLQQVTDLLLSQFPHLLLTGPSHSPSTSLAPGPSLYTVGEEVLALWKQNRKYPATILRIQEDGCYLVSFYDGFEKVVRGQCIRRVGKALQIVIWDLSK